MSNVPPPPPEPSGPVTDKVSETACRAVEVTGGLPVADGAPPTMASDRPDAPHPVVAGLPRIGEYVVVKKIGEGGMGAVYLAEDSKLGRKVAIKTMKRELAANKSDRDRFVREARAAAAVEHENIVPIWGIGEASDGSPFIAMPFLQGEMLDARLKRQPVAGLGVILKVAREVSEGLAAAHAKGLIHRDIKPGNIWLEGDLTSKEPTQQLRRCKILDFGLARSVGAEDVQITASGAIIGTPAYMAPEQARGEKVDFRADLFSLGVTLYRMATGRLPFNGPNAMAVLIALTTETPTPSRILNPNLPPALADLIDRLMSKNPDARPGSASEVSATARQIAKGLQASKSSPEVLGPSVQLGAQSNGSEVSSSRPRVLPALSEEVTESDSDSLPRVTEVRSAVRAKPKSKRAFWAAGIALALALGGGAVWLATRGDKPDPEVVKKDELKPDEPKKEEPKKEAKKDEPKAPVFDDRKAAEYVLSKGGTVQILGRPTEIQGAGELPKDAFRLVGVSLANRPGPNIDADLAVFAGCDSLTSLNLFHTRAGDAGLAHFKDCKKLQTLILAGTKISDDGLAAFRDCPDLFNMSLADTPVGNAGLTHFKNYKLLQSLSLDRTNVTDAGLAHLAGCGDLFSLSLAGASVGDAGLTHLRERTRLTQLELDATKVTDAGLNTLKALPFLSSLSVRKTTVSKARVEELAKALPACRIAWNGGVINPKGEAPAPKLDPAAERKAAEYVLSVGGTVWVEEVDGEIKAVKDLPKEPFRLRTVVLRDNQQVTDTGLAAFAGCTNLTILNLSSTKVSDAGLAHFKDCKLLKSLVLEHTQVGDAGLAHFRGCADLDHLSLSKTQTGDDGLVHFRNCKKLSVVYLIDTKVGDVGVAALKNCTQLSLLHLSNTKVSDKGLEALKGCNAFQHLSLNNTLVTDAGLVYLVGSKGLETLSLDDTAVTDVGLARLKDFGKLQSLWLTRTKVSAKGIDELAKALPKCRITWNGVVVEPKKADPAPKLDPAAERKAAEYVLSVGGTVEVNENKKPIAVATELPKNLFRLTRVDLGGNKKVTDAALAVFKDCTQLTDLRLYATAVSDAGLTHFQNCKGITSLSLHGTEIGDAGLAQFAGRDNVTSLSLSGTKVTDAGLAHFKNCTNLKQIELGLTQVGDAGLANFRGFAQLAGLHLGGTQVGDAGLAHLHDCTRLTHCTLGGTKVTAKGVADLGKALPGCRIDWDGGTLEPVTAAERKAAEYILSVGGKVHINGAGDDIKAAKDLPKEPFRLTAVFLTVPTKDADLAVFKDCKNLTVLFLGGTGITNAGLAHFGGCTSLTDLDLSGTKVDDAGLDTVKQFTKLTDLAVGQTAVTEKGVKELAKVLPGCRIQWTGGTIEPTKK